MESEEIETCLSSVSSEKNTVLTLKRREKLHAFVHFLIVLFFAFLRPETESWSSPVFLNLC